MKTTKKQAAGVKVRTSVKAGQGLPALQSNHSKTAAGVKVRTSVKAGQGLPALQSNHSKTVAR